VVVVVPCLSVFLLSLRFAASVFSMMVPRVGNSRGEVSSATSGLGPFYEHWFDFAPEFSWGNLSAYRRCGTLRSWSRGMDPSSESETASWSLCVHLEAMQAAPPLLIPPTVSASLGGSILEDDGLGV
jgi:hypothetical protein